MHPLKKYLKENGLSLADFSRLLKVTPCAVSLWITGVNTPRIRHALKIEKVTKGIVTLSSWGLIITPSGRVHKVKDVDI